MSFIEFFESYYQVFIAVACFILSFVTFFVTYFRTGSIKKSFDSAKELEQIMLKYLTDSTHLLPSQSFSPEVDQYVYDEDSNKLYVSPIKRNIQDEIESHKTCALDKILSRIHSPQELNARADAYYGEAFDYQDKLDYFSKALDTLDSVKETYGLDPNLSFEEVCEFLETEKINKLAAAKEAEKLSAEQLAKEENNVSQTPSEPSL